jgi:hypothetical protein
MKKSLRALLEGLIDYAGLFPPAALSMQDAVRNYARYRDGEYAWALGKFIVPKERAKEVPDEFPLSILWSGGLFSAVGSQLSAGLGPGENPQTTDNRQPTTSAAPQETKATTEEEVQSIADARDGRTVYVEIADLGLLDAIAQHGLRAKIRTGGITADAFPAVANIAAFLRACKEKGVAFKATAGLHHPLRCVKPLTYEPNAPTGTMHGFLNVFIAAAMVEHAEAILAEGDARAFVFEEDGLSWRGHRVTTEEIVEMRRTFATSFGSCSFEEPIGDLIGLGWLT